MRMVYPRKAPRLKQDRSASNRPAGGASDGNFVAPLGIPVLDGMGAMGEGYHSDREYIFADSMEQKARFVTALIHDW